MQSAHKTDNVRIFVYLSFTEWALGGSGTLALVCAVWACVRASIVHKRNCAYYMLHHTRPMYQLNETKRSFSARYFRCCRRRASSKFYYIHTCMHAHTHAHASSWYAEDQRPSFSTLSAHFALKEKYIFNGFKFASQLSSQFYYYYHSILSIHSPIEVNESNVRWSQSKWVALHSQRNSIFRWLHSEYILRGNFHIFNFRQSKNVFFLIRPKCQ